MSRILLFIALIVVALEESCQGFTPLKTSNSLMHLLNPTNSNIILFADGDSELEESEETSAKLSLEEKMKKWDASEEEIRAATLGGVVPDGGDRSDAFDIGLYIAFPLMVLSGLAFALFPFIMGNLDVDGVGPPPTM